MGLFDRFKKKTNTELYMIENGAHGFNKEHDAVAMEYLKSFAALRN